MEQDLAEASIERRKQRFVAKSGYNIILTYCCVVNREKPEQVVS